MIGTVDENMAGAIAVIAQKGNIAELLLHDPAEIVREPAVDHEDVELALVIGHDDVGPLGVQIFPAGDGDEHGCDVAVESCPEDTADLHHPLGAEYHEGDGAQAEEGRREPKERKVDEVLVNLV